MIKQTAILYCFLLILMSANSQTFDVKKFTLKWNDNAKFSMHQKNTITTPLVEGNLLNKDLLPTFTTSWKLQNNVSLKSYQLKNIKYQMLSKENLVNIKYNKILSDVDITMNVKNERDNTYAVLELIPLVKEGNQIKKIISFDIEYQLNNSKLNFGKNSTIKNSLLASGTWYKFSIDTTGVFKLDRDFLQSLGINTNTLIPKNIRIIGNGGALLPQLNSEFRYDGLQENAIKVIGEDDNSFDASDYVLFYGKGPHSWKMVNGTLEHQNNIYSDNAYYFISTDSGEGKRIANKPDISDSATIIATSYDDYTFYEKDQINLFAIGKQWFGENFNIQNDQSIKIPFSNFDNSKNATLKVRAVAASSSTSSMSVKANGQDLFSLNFNAASGLNKAYANFNAATFNINNEVITVDLNYNNNGNPSAKAYLDYIEIIGAKKLIATGKQFGFRNFDANNSSEIIEYQIQNASNISEIWDISDYINPKTILNQSTSEFTFKTIGSLNQEFIVLNENDYYSPQKVENSFVENQNLHQLKDIDYLIITQDFLINQAERLAEYHQQNSGLNTAVIPLNQIYNEFASGSPDLTAIRDFVKHLYDNASSSETKIKYVCLFGDASYDYKDRISGNNNIVPVFEDFGSFNLAFSYVTDDYYGMMDANEGLLSSTDLQDVVTGRIPVSDVLQAERVVSKILKYYSSDAYGDWRNQLTLIADDIDATGEQALEINMEQIADTIKNRKPIFNIKKIYLDAYEQQTSSGGTRYPDVNTAISNAVEKGTLVVDYFGHGGEDGWASERVLEVPQIQSWNNPNTLPLLITVTCEFSKFDNPLRETAGEYVLWNSNGGSSSLITTTREIFLSTGRAINEQLIKVLFNFNNEDYTIAESLMFVKNKFSNTQKYFIFTLGDPAMKLAIPKANIKITKMNNVDLSQATDTIKALSHTTFEGFVTDQSGNTLPDFNGELMATIFDKEFSKSTLDNDNSGFVMNFDALESKIFRGRAAVQNGQFKFDFIAPKDIRIAYGKAKVSLYADDDTKDKAGYNFDITIGGINTDAPEDNTGPTIQLYMNDESFIDGGSTNASPLFIAVLSDENGINTSITSVDHDIIAILDGDVNNPINLNDFYQTELNDYKNGKVNYQFRNLSPGLHTITLKAWDTYNNSSEVTLTFIVVDTSDLVLNNVLNYPNPFVNYTEFWFNHNKPNETLEVQVQVFTVSGKLVKTINQLVQSNETLSRSITWDGLDDFGKKIGKGVYVYKLKVKSILSNAKAEKFEKLVILQ